MGFGRFASAVSVCAALLAPSALEAATAEDSKQPNFRCENCSGGPGPFNGDRSTDVVVKVDGHKQRLLNARGLEKAKKGFQAFNVDPAYLELVSAWDGKAAWVLNVRQRMPEPQASRTLRRYY
jgi:hypothetical protein